MHQTLQAIRKVATALLSLVPMHQRGQAEARLAFETARGAVQTTSGQTVPDVEFEKLLRKFATPA